MLGADEEWFENHGTMPGGLAGKRVYVELVNGMKPELSWPADGDRHARTDWTRSGSNFDIKRWRPA